MTDKVQKIREEVERLKSLIGNNSFLSDYEKGFNDGREDICDNLISFIDSLQEEPKFKTGDRIKPVDSCLGVPRTILEVCNSWYVTDQGTLDFEYEDNWEAIEEPVSDDLEKAADKYSETIESYYPNGMFDSGSIYSAFKAGAQWQKTKDESATEDLGEYINELSKQFPEVSFAKLSRIAVRVAKWQKKHLWKPADGDDLPEIDREVIALLDNGKVVFAHRPPEFWDGKNIITGKVTRNYPKTYDKGGWNMPDVKWWLDVKLPKEIEL